MTTPEVTLEPMTDADFAAWVEAPIASYAAGSTRTGLWSAEEALDASRAMFAKLLPNGPRSKDQHLYTVRDAADGRAVGYLWINIRPKAGRTQAYVYEVGVDEDLRGLGYGRAIMNACVARSRELGAQSVGLHVFGHNTVARELYKSLGFRETDVTMSLQLTPDDKQDEQNG
jgi:ribosomal protein S18 acetylase RimI-like enzyme